MFTSICKYGVFGSSLSPYVLGVSSWGYVNCDLFNYFKLFCLIIRMFSNFLFFFREKLHSKM